MFELFLTIIFSTLIIISFRLINKFKIDELGAIVVNYFFATAWGVVFWKQAINLQDFAAKPWFALSLVIGVLFIVTFFLLSRSTAKAGLAITAVASRMSVLIPIIAGLLLFNDSLSFLKVLGICLALISFFLIFKPKGKMKVKVGRILPPFLLFLGIGTNDTIMKYIQYHFLNGDETLLLVNVFFISLLIGLVLLVIRYVKKSQTMSYKELLAGFILGTLNFGATYYFIRSMMILESVVLFPLVNVGIVTLTSISGLLFFREKLSRINWIGIFTAVIAIVIISMS